MNSILTYLISNSNQLITAVKHFLTDVVDFEFRSILFAVIKRSKLVASSYKPQNKTTRSRHTFKTFTLLSSVSLVL